MDSEKTLLVEKETITEMIHLFCRRRHGQKDALCAECAELERYAHQRLERCQFMPLKPVCAKCPVHCYKPSARQQIREVMRFAGPRMLVSAPGAALRHIWQMFKPESARVRRIRARLAKTNLQARTSQETAPSQGQGLPVEVTHENRSD